MAFDSHYHGRVVALAKHLLRPKKHKLKRKPRLVYQFCVTEKQGPWRSSVKPFKAAPLSGGLYWNNFIVWSNRKRTLFYDVGREEMRECPPPCSMKHEPYWVYPHPCHIESGGHLYFFHVQGRSRLIIEEMNQNLSCWFVKHSIALSQIASSLFRSIGWGWKFRINSLIEEKEGTALVVIRCHENVVLYRIQDNKSWKLYEWEKTICSFESSFFDEHVPTIYRFHDQ